MTKENRDTVTEAVLDYLKKDINCGALQIIGEWGCGKTYHLLHTVFDEILKAKIQYPIVKAGKKSKKETPSLTPIRVSLFGMSSVDELPKRIILASNSWRKLGGKILEGVKKVADNAKEIDITKYSSMIGVGVGGLIPFIPDYSGVVYTLIPPEKYVLCFDDLERAMSVIDPDELWGAINEFVENHGYKVIIISNRGQLLQQHNKEEILKFEEKVVDKTVEYRPNLTEIFSEIVSASGNKGLIEFMKDNVVMESITPYRPEYLELSKELSNLRTLKFAFSHFKEVFTKICGENEVKDELLKKKLLSYWIFILAISVEYKSHTELICDEYKCKLQEYSPILSFSGLLDDDEIKIAETKVNPLDENAKRFHDNFFGRSPLQYVFYEELYDYVISGRDIDYDKLAISTNKVFDIQGDHINPAQECLTSFTNDIFVMSDEDFKTSLQKLLDYTVAGELDSYNSYAMATWFVQKFREFFADLSEDELKDKIKSGIETFSKSDRADGSNSVVRDIKYARSNNPEQFRWVYDFILSTIEERSKERLTKEMESLEKLFMKDIRNFVAQLVPIHDDYTVSYQDIPILENFDNSLISKKMPLSSSDAVWLTNLMRQRYLENADFHAFLGERSFVQALKNEVDKIDTKEKVLSNYTIGARLKPTVDEALAKLEPIAS